MMSSSTELMREDPYGQIRNVSITIKGPNAPGLNTVEIFKQVATERNLFTEVSINAKNKFKAPRMLPETLEQLQSITQWDSVLCLSLYTYEVRCQGRNIEVLDGLLLQCLPGKVENVRIGIVTQMSWGLFEKCTSESAVCVV